jgi:hypothetical protein
MEQLNLQQIETLNIYQRILGIMSEIDYIQKGSDKVNGQYRFVSHDQVTAAIHPLLVKYRIIVIPTVEECIQENNRTRIKLAVVFRNVDKPDEAFAVYQYGYGVDNSDKGIGKAVSYAFKYACLKVFCLETGEDPDNDAKASYEPEKCLEFDSLLPQDYTAAKLSKVNKFIEERSKAFNKHPEDIKREAIKRMQEFLAAVEKWNPKKKE